MELSEAEYHTESCLPIMSITGQEIHCPHIPTYICDVKKITSFELEEFKSVY